MERRIYVSDLDCFRLAGEEMHSEKLAVRDLYFDLSLLPTEGLQDEISEYIWNRGRVLALKSIRKDLSYYRKICRFLKEEYPSMESIGEEEPDALLRKLKKWMMKNGYPLVNTKMERESGRTVARRSPVTGFMERVISFCSSQEIPEMEKDVWELLRLGFPVRNHPVQPVRTLNFTGIPQKGIREEVKRTCFITLRYAAVRTVVDQIHAVKRLAQFLQREYPFLDSLQDLKREMLEEYLVELNTRVRGKKSFTTELHGLKSLLDMTGKIYEAPNLCHIFLPGDIPTQRNAFTKPYSDGEVKRLNQSVVEMQEQLARAIIIHEMMGNRISETLTLKQDCLVERGPNTMVRVFMVKTQRYCEKPVPKEAAELIRKSIAYTERMYGKHEYVFVNDKKPDLPMTYDYLRYHLRVMFREEGLLDDQGRPFGMGTHRFRNTLGQRLTEMHVEDETIAQILGHSGTRSVKNYRKFGNKAMAEETKNVRESMDEVLSQLMQGW